MAITVVNCVSILVVRRLRTEFSSRHNDKLKIPVLQLIEQARTRILTEAYIQLYSSKGSIVKLIRLYSNKLFYNIH